MTIEELAAEISMRRDIPLEDVEEVLEEEDVIAYEEYTKTKKRKRMCFIGTLMIFLAGVVAAIVILDRKEKIDAQAMIKVYSDTAKVYSDKMIGKINELQSKLQKMV
ncbi:MAG: hypothetical protein J5962_05645 [Lachnospiraceae bacterium]|nr:hypothetical protein [Lachnospiraceae bacterium]